MDIAIGLLIVAVATIIIWKSGESFGSASDFLGRNLSDGVKGATINAIGSSMPELLTTFFFLFILKNADGFAAGLGTTVGSAVFNAVVIPFVVGMSVFFKYKNDKLKFSKKVIFRDGIALILINILLLIIVKHSSDGGFSGLSWKEGGVLMIFYIFYLVYLFAKMDKSDKKDIDKNKQQDKIEKDNNKIVMLKSMVTLNFLEIFVGNNNITNKKAWSLLLFSMIIMSAGCYGLVEASIYLGGALGVKTFVVSVIIVAAATSVPDTYLSYKDASKGNYDDSISNAFGSNIFDIGFAIGFPVFVFGLMYGDIHLTAVEEHNISELLVLLLVITVAVFVIFIAGKGLTMFKLLMLFSLYLLFVSVVLLKAFEVGNSEHISKLLYSISMYFEF